MINKLHSLFHQPDRGWDPVSKEHAQTIYNNAWQKQNQIEKAVKRLEKTIGSLKGKKILDLGAGPGQYSIAFAKAGADVTWHDISTRYLEMTKTKAEEEKVTLHYSLGYLEESRRFPLYTFDLIFVRGAWYYCMNDTDFAKILYSRMKQGGYCYIITNHQGILSKPETKVKRWNRFQYLIYNNANYKIGHTYPAQGKLGDIFSSLGAELLTCSLEDPDYEHYDELLLRKRERV